MKKLALLILCCLTSSMVFAQAARHDYVTYKGDRFWVEQAGQGKPTYILFNGADESLEQWNKFIPSFSKKNHVVAYDRAGIGKSLPLSNQTSPRTAKGIVKRLRGILAVEKITPPYVLIANSIGANYARYFMRRYPQDVKHVILINPMLNAAIAGGEIKHYAKGQQAEQVIFRQQYNRNFNNLKEAHLNLLKNSRAGLNVSQTARVENYLELLGETKTETQIRSLPVASNIPLVIVQSNKASSLEQTMAKQLIAESRHGQYLSMKNMKDLASLAPEKLRALINNA